MESYSHIVIAILWVLIQVMHYAWNHFPYKDKDVKMSTSLIIERIMNVKAIRI